MSASPPTSVPAVEEHWALIERLWQKDQVGEANRALNELFMALGLEHRVVDCSIPPTPYDSYPAEFKTASGRVLRVAELRARVQRRPATSPISLRPEESELIAACDELSEEERGACLDAGREALISLIRGELRDLQALLSLICDDDGWTEIANSSGIRSLYRYEADGTATVTIKVHGIVDRPVLDVLVLCNEVDLVETFVPRVACEKLKQVSLFRQLVYTRLSIPWPAHDRDMLMDARGVDLLELGQIAIRVRDPGHADDRDDVWSLLAEGELPAVKEGTTRIKLKVAGGCITPVGPSATLVSMVVNADPQVAWVPQALLNWITKHISYYGFKFFRDKAHRIPGSEHEKRLNENEDVYGEIRARLDDDQLCSPGESDDDGKREEEVGS